MGNTKSVKRLYRHLVGQPSQWKTLCRRCVKTLRESGEYVSDTSKHWRSEVGNACDQCGATATETTRTGANPSRVIALESI
jgi:hypothetical protein